MVALQKAGRCEEAITQAMHLLRIMPGSAEAHRNMGFIYAAGGRSADAVRHFEQALRLDPNDKAADEGLRRSKAVMERNGS